jgi:hypothetical protein
MAKVQHPIEPPPCDTAKDVATADEEDNADICTVLTGNDFFLTNFINHKLIVHNRLVAREEKLMDGISKILLNMHARQLEARSAASVIDPKGGVYKVVNETNVLLSEVCAYRNDERKGEVDNSEYITALELELQSITTDMQEVLQYLRVIEARQAETRATIFDELDRDERTCYKRKVPDDDVAVVKEEDEVAHDVIRQKTSVA